MRRRLQFTFMTARPSALKKDALILTSKVLVGLKDAANCSPIPVGILISLALGIVNSALVAELVGALTNSTAGMPQDDTPYTNKLISEANTLMGRVLQPHLQSLF